LLKNDTSLVANKYIDSITTKTIELKKQEFRNFAVSHSNEDGVD